MEEAVIEEKKVRARRAGPKLIGLNALLNKKYDFLEGLPGWMARMLGQLVSNFVMIIWGQSGSGKSDLLYALLSVFLKFGNALYLSLEEGVEATAQMKALRHLNEGDHGGKILFGNHLMTYEETVLHLKRKKSPRFVVIDSVQYWDINYAKYKHLKEMFPKKSFIFISHAEARNPDGKTAKKIRYDASVKVFVEGFVAFPVSRYGGNLPHVIWEGDGKRGAIPYWGKRKVNEFKK